MSQHDPEQVTLTPQPVAMLRETVPMDALPDFFDRAYHLVASVLQTQGVSPAGPPLGIYYGMPTDTVDVGAGFPTDRPATPDAGVTVDTLPGGPAVQLVHEGSYDTLEVGYGRLMGWFGEQDQTPGSVMWESYLTEPHPDHPEDTRTLLVWPLEAREPA